MSPAFHLLWMLCAIGAAVFAAAAATWRAATAMALGLVTGILWLSMAGAPGAAAVGGAAAMVAAFAIARPGVKVVPAAFAGGLSALWLSLLEAQGLHVLPAAAIAVALPAASAWLAVRQPDFAPPHIRDEGHLLILTLALIVAASPALVSGWHSAAALNLQQAESSSQPAPEWALAVAAGAAGLGGLSAVWRRA